MENLNFYDFKRQKRLDLAAYLGYNAMVQGYSLKGGLQICSEHTSQRSFTEKKSTGSEKECLHQTAERF